MARPVTLFTGQWADLPLEELAEKAGALGLRRPRARLLGRPLRGRPGARRRRLRRRRAASCSSGTTSTCFALGAHLVGQAVCDPIDERHRAILPPEVWGDGDPEGVRAARGRADEGHRARGRAARRPQVERLHRLGDLAPALLLPAERLRRDRARLRGLRRALGADHRRLRRRGRALRARGAPDRDRLRLRHHAQDARRDRQPRGLRDQPRPEPLRAPVPRLGGVRAEFADRIYHVHVKDSQAAARRAPLDPRLAPRTSARPSAAGTSSRPATATSTSRSSSAR